MNAPVKIGAVMQIMDPSGHLTVMWDKSKPAEVDAAKAQFDKFRKEGYSAFRTVDGDEKGERMDKFDPEAKGVIMIAPLKGG